MGNIIEHNIIRPIVYGPHKMKNTLVEQEIHFLEDQCNDSKPLPSNLFRQWEIQEINETGRREYAEQLRESLLDLPGG